jgi:hypothetical protein
MNFAPGRCSPCKHGLNPAALVIVRSLPERGQIRKLQLGEGNEGLGAGADLSQLAELALKLCDLT